MKTWLLNLIKHKISVSPIIVRDESGNIIKVIWHATQRGTGFEHHGDSPTSAANNLINKIECNTIDDTSVA